jgi:phosphoribosyl-ATP pyrophosphohydrolase/phosphoribosyl-AMP cyclohydrolase
MLDVARLDFAKGNGRVTVVAQDARTGAVLMVAQADREAIERTIETGEMHYTSRTRGPWHKGATSGNVQRVISLEADCDGDAVLARVAPAGPACHTGSISCFGDAALGADALGVLARTIEARASEAPAGSPPRFHDTAEASAEGQRATVPPGDIASAKPSYTRRLLADRNLRLKKIGEEAAELVVALADEDRERATEEGVDLVYHALVALRAAGVTLDDVRRVAEARGAGR